MKYEELFEKSEIKITGGFKMTSHEKFKDLVNQIIEKHYKNSKFKVKWRMLKRKEKYSAYRIPPDGPQRIIDRIFFNRNEGYEVMYMIQKIVDRFGFETESYVNRIEDLIVDKLPGEYRLWADAFSWLADRLLYIRITGLSSGMGKNEIGIKVK